MPLRLKYINISFVFNKINREIIRGLSFTQNTFNCAYKEQMPPLLTSCTVSAPGLQNQISQSNLGTDANTSTNNSRYLRLHVRVEQLDLCSSPGSLTTASARPVSVFTSTQNSSFQAAVGSIRKFVHLTDAETTLKSLKQEISDRYARIYSTHIVIVALRSDDGCDYDDEYQAKQVFDDRTQIKIYVVADDSKSEQANGHQQPDLLAISGVNSSISRDLINPSKRLRVSEAGSPSTGLSNDKRPRLDSSKSISPVLHSINQYAQVQSDGDPESSKDPVLNSPEPSPKPRKSDGNSSTSLKPIAEPTTEMYNPYKGGGKLFKPESNNVKAEVIEDDPIEESPNTSQIVNLVQHGEINMSNRSHIHLEQEDPNDETINESSSVDSDHSDHPDHSDHSKQSAATDKQTFNKLPTPANQTQLNVSTKLDSVETVLERASSSRSPSTSATSSSTFSDSPPMTESGEQDSSPEDDRQDSEDSSVTSQISISSSSPSSPNELQFPSGALLARSTTTTSAVQPRSPLLTRLTERQPSLAFENQPKRVPSFRSLSDLARLGIPDVRESMTGIRAIQSVLTDPQSGSTPTINAAQQSSNGAKFSESDSDSSSVSESDNEDEEGSIPLSRLASTIVRNSQKRKSSGFLSFLK
ncbi:uncharacterized protein V1516DRAFT_49064 [Lipomyces oligophaga]|uniref:uncharacterized protein n=1 Tax=Lipomyces oligophaga TaxID=45792 RepID=UPI0034CEA35B